MMIFIFSGCMRKDENIITSEEAGSTIVENSNDTKTNDNESKEENTEESAVKLSDFINPDGNTLFTPFYHSKGI